MTEFWEKSFIENQTRWGFEPTDSAIFANDFFIEKEIKDVLIPGIGYGRNAKLFLDSGIKVTGIEISRTAIDLATQHYGTNMNIYHGSVTDMPYDNHLRSEEHTSELQSLIRLSYAVFCLKKRTSLTPLENLRANISISISTEYSL